MLHQGKNFPYTLRKELKQSFFTYDNWPRKWWMSVGTGFGSKAAVWTGVTMLSDVAVEWGPDYLPRWIFTNETDPTQQVFFDLEVRRVPIEPFPQTGFDYGIVIKYMNDGTFMGDSGNPIGIPPIPPLKIFLDLGFFWHALTDPTKFASLYNSNIWAATWDEQPEYHPYRTRP